MKKIEVKVNLKLKGNRLDIALVKADLGLSRRKIRAAIDAGGVYLNGNRVRVSSREVVEGDIILMEYNPEAIKKIKKQEFKITEADIIFMDDGVIALNKPPGLASQPVKGKTGMHVVACLEKYFEEQGVDPGKLALAHRLDMETSGIILVARNDETAKWLMDGFREKKITKTYWAICKGLSKVVEFKEECLLSSIKPKVGLVKKVNSGGKSSLTHFKVLTENKDQRLSLIECRPFTGRSHQIRVHLDLHQLPILGDKRYGNHRQQKLDDTVYALSAEHHMLHARQLQFKPGPQQKPVEITAPPPPNFTAIHEKVFKL